MNFSPLTFINAKSKRCILSSCLLRLCNSLFELAPRGFVPESECKSTATLPNYQIFCRLFSGNFLRRTARKHAKPHEHSNLYTQKKIQKKYQERRKTTERNGKGKGKKAYTHTPTARNAWDLVSPRAKPQQQSKRKRNPHFGKTTSIIAGTICGLCLNEMRTSFTLPATLRKQGRCRVSGNCAIFGKALLWLFVHLPVFFRKRRTGKRRTGKHKHAVPIRLVSTPVTPYLPRTGRMVLPSHRR